VEGRSLQPEMITLGGDRKIPAGREADWSRELTRATVISAVRFLLTLGAVQYAWSVSWLDAVTGR